MKKISRKLLLIFSFALLSAGGIVWACGGGDWDDGEYSNFTPEAFVDHQYSPFFYTSWQAYYGTDINDDSNTRYNEQVVKEWGEYLDHKVNSKDLSALLFRATSGQLDSSYRYFKGKLHFLPASIPDLKSTGLKKAKVDAFFSYLTLAKQCESFAVSDVQYSWDVKTTVVNPAPLLKTNLMKAFDQGKDQFIKQRLWFQLIRYSYFEELPALNADSSAGPDHSGLVTLFNKYESAFPKNSIYYRAMGYLAGHYYKRQDYAQANYLYSLCYNYSSAMKIPSKWSFHPQNEKDWEQSLLLAKNKEEQITLWQMLGIVHDESRAIEKIYDLNPQSDKLDLLLSRLINKAERPGDRYEIDSINSIKINTNDLALVERIAANGNTHKPYFWNLAAGYLNTLNKNYMASGKFYNQAKKQLPENDRLAEAQYRLLDWTLYLARLTTIDAKAEKEMVSRLNWLADLRDKKDTIANFRYDRALTESILGLAERYKKQGDVVKSNCFKSTTAFYASNENIKALQALLTKQNKTPFEQAMLRYYHLTMKELYYHQALMLVYQENTDAAIPLLQLADDRALIDLPANPFNSRINDCHDCDFNAFQKKKYTALSFVTTIRDIKAEITAGKNLYTNNLLLGNAYYNITHYGNARAFYQNNITGYSATSPMDIAVEFRDRFTSAKIAEKYYLIARNSAQTKEQKAKCTFMAAKCERNDLYNASYTKQAKDKKYYWDFDFSTIPVGQYFAELKNKFFQTTYYKEVLKECGYFRSYNK